MDEITYRKVGDYLLPNLTNSDNETYDIGKYGMLRRTFLVEHKKGRLNGYMRKGTLPLHLYQVNLEAETMMETLQMQMMKAENVTDQLKEQDQLGWVGAVNNIKARAEEIVLAEIVYA